MSRPDHDYVVGRNMPPPFGYKRGTVLTDVSRIPAAMLARYCVPVRKGTFTIRPTADSGASVQAAVTPTPTPPQPDPAATEAPK